MSSRTILRAAALAAAALTLTACNDPAGGSATGANPPAPAASRTASGAVPRTSAPASAGAADHGLDSPPKGQALVAGLPLHDWEWGNGYKPNGDDDDSLTMGTFDASCRLQGDHPVDGLTGRMMRTVKLPGRTADDVAIYGESEAMAFSSAAAAHRELAGEISDSKRCPSYTEAKTGNHYSAVHEVAAPAVANADEVYAEEGTAVFALDGGRKTDPFPYVYLVARKGAVTFTVFVDVEDGRGPAVARATAQEAMRTLAIKW